MNINRLALEKELGKRSFHKFVKMAWDAVFPGEKYSDAIHSKAICDHLEALHTGKLNKNLAISVPPGHGKSVIATIFFPAWVWITKPSACLLYSSYNQEILEEMSVRCADFMISDWYQERWGDIVQPKDGNWNKFTIKNNAGGIRWAVPIKGTITGRHVDFLFIDDPIRPKDVDNKELQTIQDLYTRTVPSRVAKKKGKIICIMQRLREHDLAGFLMDKQDFEPLIFPAEYEEGKYTYNCLGRYDPRTKEGEILWPEFYPREKLDLIKMALGPFEYAAQYQQSPVPAEGSLFKREQLKFWKELPAGNIQFVQSWDTTLSSTVNSDYVVGQVWAKCGGEFYLVDQVRARMDFESTKNAIKSLSAKWPKAITKYIELKASGPDVINSLRKEVPGLVGVKVTGTSGNKEQRAVSISGLFAAGNVYIPDPSIYPWVHDFMQEICSFPRARHDDQVDAMSQALIHLHKRSLSSIISTLKNKVAWRG